MPVNRKTVWELEPLNHITTTSTKNHIKREIQVFKVGLTTGLPIGFVFGLLAAKMMFG